MSETKQFGVPEVLAALEAAVAERGEDYVYHQPVNARGETSGCLYVHDRDSDNPTPGCIAGQVYFDLTGKLVPANLEVGMVESGLADEWINEGTFTHDAIRVLGEAQYHQDLGIPWGLALREARRVAEGLQNG